MWCVLIPTALQPTRSPSSTRSCGSFFFIPAGHMYPHGSLYSSLIILCFNLFFLHSVCPTCCSPSPSLRPSWCLWWTCDHPRNILHSPPSIRFLLEPFSSSSSFFSHHQPLQCSLWRPKFVWSDLQSSFFQSEMKSLVWLHQTEWGRWLDRGEPLPVDRINK